jgi:uncharacterized protein with HEPN domain
MSKRDDKVSIADMLSHAREALDLFGSRTRDNFFSDRMAQLAATRLVEIIGEAANRVTSEMKNRHPDIPWRSIIDTRNRLIHGYDVIDLNILWSTLTTDLPPLIAMLEAISD